MMKIRASLLSSLALIVIGVGFAFAQAPNGEHWVVTWAASPQQPRAPQPPRQTELRKPWRHPHHLPLL